MYLPADAPEDTNGRYERIDHEDLDADEDDALLSPTTKVAYSPTRETPAGGGWFGGWGRGGAAAPSTSEKHKSE